VAWTENPGSTVGDAVGDVFTAVEKCAQAGVSAAALGQAQQAAQGLPDAASSGQIRITEKGVNILIDALNQCDTYVQTLQDNVRTVAQSPKLGGSPYARLVAAHVEKGGTGLTQSADAVVNQFQEVLKHYPRGFE
jgi:hypothetical protein